MTQFVVVVDTVAVLMGVSTSKHKGSVPFVRIRDPTGSAVSSRPIVKDLPYNAYDQDWVRSLPDSRAMRPQPVYYPFTHDNELLK